jgi:thiamine biosynthesis protein ThiI
VRIPFYKLNSAFADMAKDQQYLLYCDKGVMSQLHAAHLLEQGYNNVGVYRPDTAKTAAAPGEAIN